MPAARHTDWTHVHVVGERAAAAPYVPYARKLLGWVMQDAAYNQLSTHKAQRVLDDGTVVTAEKIGGIPRITINPAPPRGPKRPIRLLDSFVFCSAEHGYIDGNPTWPPVILSYDDKRMRWSSYFFQSTSPGAGSSTAQRTGTYSDVFDLYRESAQQLLTANRTWEDDDGNTCAYTAPVGPFEPCYRHPATLYGATVQALGRLVFSLDAATYAAGWRVLAAARKDGTFYALVAQLGALPDDPMPDPSTAYQVWHTQRFATQEYQFALLKVPSVPTDDPVTGVRYLKAITTKATQMWSGSLALAYGLWRFNSECTEVVTYRLPEHTFLEYEPGTTDGEWNPTTSSTLTTTTDRIAITIGDDSATIATTVANTAIFEEYGRVLHLVFEDALTANYVLDDTTYPALRYVGAGLDYNATLRQLLYADLRNECFIFRETQTHFFSNTRDDVDRIIVATADGETIVVEDDTAFGTADYNLPKVYRQVLDDTAALNPSSLARAHLAAAGVFRAKIPWIEPVDAPTLEIFGYSQALARALAVQGASFGGIAVSRDGATWTITQNMGYAPDANPDYHYSPNACAPRVAASSRTAVAYMSKEEGMDANHLTNGELPGYYGGAGAMNGHQPFGVYILGKPLSSQPLEREVV